ncbi:MAG TPA: hypothetical protein VGH97_17605 [Thermoanaerobaculia bacterium]|jgi:hypothetical protein
MRLPRSLRSLLWIVPFSVIALVVSCSKSDTTTAPGAIATVTVDAPDTATSGQSFDVTVDATAVGVNNVQNGVVAVTVPAPLAVQAVSPSSGTTASFTSGSATWNLGTLDSNSNSSLHVTIMGTLPAGSTGQAITITASMTATGINAGDAVASDSVQLNP